MKYKFLKKVKSSFYSEEKTKVRKVIPKENSLTSINSYYSPKPKTSSIKISHNNNSYVWYFQKKCIILNCI